jgi:hypothetical protein
MKSHDHDQSESPLGTPSFAGPGAEWSLPDTARLIMRGSGTRWSGAAVIASIILGVLAACGGDASPTPTAVPPEARTATATIYDATSTASAEIAERDKLTCVLEPDVLEVVGLLSDELWDAGNAVRADDPTRGLELFEASIAYGVLTECREIAVSPAPDASPIASTPFPCPPGMSPKVVERLRDAAAKGMAILFQLVLAGAETDDLELIAALNGLFMQRASDLEIACGYGPPGTPEAGASPSSTT